MDHNLELFSTRIIADSKSGCWIWNGQLNRHGYGVFGGRGAAHRWSYQTFSGPIPAKLELDHLCSVPRCVNPSHLEPVTHLENMRRGQRHGGRVNSRKTVCVLGHPYDAVRRQRDGWKRVCKKCEVIANRKYRAGLKP